MNDQITEVTQAIVDLLTTNKSALGLTDIYYGDENNIPRTPSVAVVPSYKSRTIQETGMTTVNEFEVILVVYHSRLGAVQVTRKECDELAESIETLLHVDKRLGNRLYTSHVVSITPGYATRTKVIMQATRITWQGRSKTRI